MIKKTFKQTDYSKKLLDPRWQKKRLEILNRDKFKCRSCDDETSTLHVHHKCYKPGYEPWEIENEHLVTLCCDCHKLEEGLLSEYSKMFIQCFRESEFMADDLRELAWGVMNVSLMSEKSWLVATAYSYAFISTDIQLFLMKLVSEYRQSKSTDFNEFAKSKLVNIK